MRAKGVIKEFFSEMVVFLVRKGSYTTLNTVKIREIWEKKGKIRKTRSMTKRRSSEILAVKIEIFSEKTSFRNLGPRKICPSPQTRRQVSATETLPFMNSILVTPLNPIGL